MSSKFTSNESSKIGDPEPRKKSPNMSINSVATSQISFEETLASDIEKNLVRIQKIAR